MNLLHTLASWVVTAAVAIGIIAPINPSIEIPQTPEIPPVSVVDFEDPIEPTLSAALPKQDALIDTYLASGIDANDTTMTLADGESRDGVTLSGRYCFTVDMGSPSLEYICGIASSTSITDLERGVKVSNPNATSSDLAFSHRRFAPVQVTDFPFNQLVQRQLNGTDSFSAALSYDTDVTPTGNSHLTDVEYVLSVVNGGTVSFDKQIVAGTAGETMSAGALLYLDGATQRWKKVDTDTVATYQNKILGLAQGSGTDGNAITGGVLLRGLDTSNVGMSAGSVYYATGAAGVYSTVSGAQPIGLAISATNLLFEPTAGAFAGSGYSNTFTSTNTFTSATTTFDTKITGHASTSLSVYTSNGTWTKPQYLEYAEVWVCGGGGGVDTDFAGSGGAGSGGCAFEILSASELSATTSVNVIVGAAGTRGATATAGGTSSFGSFLSATGGAVGIADFSGSDGGSGSGGDLNFTGGKGGTAGGSDTGSSGTDNECAGAGGQSQLAGYGTGSDGTDDPNCGISNINGSTAGVVTVRSFF